MGDLEVDVGRLCRAHASEDDYLAAELDALDHFVRGGLAEMDDRRVAVPRPMRAFLRTVCATFDQYLAVGRGRHARAV